MRKEILKSMAPFLPSVAVAGAVGLAVAVWQSPQLPQLVTAVAATNAESSGDASGNAVVGDFDLEDGVYEGSAYGYSAYTEVAVTIENRTITDIEIESYGDDETFFQRATAVVDEILAEQSLDVDVVSGATYSSNGIIDAVNNALTGEEGSQSPSEDEEVSVDEVDESGTYKDGTYTGEGQGFNGTIKVQVTIKNSKIKNIRVLESSDDASYFNKAKALLKNIIKKQTTNVDTVSGATYSSAGLIEAVRDALSKAETKSSSSDKSGSSSTTSSDEAATPSVTGAFPYADGTYQGSGYGFGGTITVNITLSNQTLTAIEVVSADGETPSYFAKAKAIINSIISAQSTDVDVVSGATYSCNGIKQAVNNAIATAAGQAVTTPTASDSGTTEEETIGETVDISDASEGLTYKNGTYSESVTCEPDEDEEFDAYTLSADITIAEDRIVSISNVAGSGSGYASYDKAYITTAFNGLNAKILALTDYSKLGSVDTVSGATCSSNSIIQLCISALNDAKAAGN